MAATLEGNREINRKLIEKHGRTHDGKSVFHAELGEKSTAGRESYFATLKREDPVKLREISIKAAVARKAKKKFKYGLNVE